MSAAFPLILSLCMKSVLSVIAALDVSISFFLYLFSKLVSFAHQV